MKHFKIYTAGKMAGLSYEEQMGWRKEIERLIRQKTEANITFIHPLAYYRYDKTEHKSEREVKSWDLNQVKDSDIVIVNLSDIADSIGTHYELGVIDAMNSFGYKHIYVIGVGKPNTNHPWIDLTLLRQEDNFEDAAEYVVNYLLL